MTPLDRAAGYRILGAALAYPDPPALAPMLGALAREPGPAAAIGAALAPLVDADLCGEHNRLFAQSVAASPYESAYSGTDKGASMAQLAALYGAFGMRAGGAEHEAPDHAGVEVEFAALLCLKEALCLEQGRDADLVVTRAARRVFLEEHLGRWAGAFGQRLRAVAAHAFYARLGDLIALWVARDLEESGWEAPPARAPLPVAAMEEDGVDCRAAQPAGSPS